MIERRFSLLNTRKIRDHPLAFLRADLAADRFQPCAVANRARVTSAIRLAGLVLMRQRPGSAKGVMFITLEDKTGVANLVIWTTIYEKHRRIILTASMLGVVGRVQRDGEVVHIVAHQLGDLSSAPSSLGGRDAPFPLPHGRGDEFARGPSRPDPRNGPPRGVKTRDIFIPDLHIDTLKQKTREFR